MNGSWILGWQLATNYFARRRELTSVYMGCYLTVTGVQRLIGPPLGALMVELSSRREALFIGGSLVMLSALHAWRQAESEKVDGHYPTFAEKERVRPGDRGAGLTDRRNAEPRSQRSRPGGPARGARA